MTPESFRARLKALGLTIRAFATRTGVDIVTASYWGRVRPGGRPQVFPLWVDPLLAGWERCPDLLFDPATLTRYDNSGN